MNKWLRRVLLAFYLPASQNLILIWQQVSAWLSGQGKSAFARGICLLFLLAVQLLPGVYLHVMPARDRVKMPLRLRVMMGGRGLVYCGLYGMLMQVLVFFCVYPQILTEGLRPVSVGVLIANGILGVCTAFLYLANGVIRIFCTSRRLSIVRRIVMLLTMWIPLVNLAVLLYACRLVYEEYDFERDKLLLRELRTDTRLCATRYPLLLVHGIGFRDLRYFNYWGRIPRELMRNGAVIYYGNQEALGTVASNAEDIRRRILEIREETGCEKVNILAHSKGGLDARYAISCLGMAPYVASLTTMNTPHRGCRFVDYACRLPEGLYRWVAKCFDRTFARFGDRNPDFYTATHQFSTEETARLNEQMPDAPQVYYQSYMSKMKHAFSHLLLAIPYCMIRPLEGDNDGLVSVDSARWGEFQGVISNVHSRGISHGDMIDLKREDYPGFDVTETYVQIVVALKNRGF